MHGLDAIFGVKNDVSTAQECARALLIFGYGLVLVRIAGRRVFGKWSALDIIVSIVIGSNLSRALTGSAPLWGTLAACAVLMALHWVLATAAARWAPFSHLLEGKAVRLGGDGEVKQATRVWHSISEADLDEALRQRGVASVAETRLVTLEPSGTITVLK